MNHAARSADFNRPQRWRNHAALRLLALAIEADALGRPEIWLQAPFGKLDRRYARFLGETLLRIVRKPLPKARYGLGKYADQLERGRGRYSWHGQYNGFADDLAESIRVFAEGLPRKPRGNPKFSRGSTASASQRVVNQAYDRLMSLAHSVEYEGWQSEVHTPGRAGRPSRGRDLIARAALEIATEADDLHSPAECIRERIKSDRRSQRRAAARSLRQPEIRDE